jgi:enhancing lycopene biosynthesis protein 2
MALLEDMFKGGTIVTGLAVGIGAAVFAPVLIPALRPIAKSIIKAGLIAYDQGRVALAELNEQTGDIIAEARAELAEAVQTAKGAASS